MFTKLFAALHLDQVFHIGTAEGLADLAVQVAAVDYDQHGGVFQLVISTQHLGRVKHQQRLARTLKMPDQAFFWVTLFDPLNNLLSRLELRVTRQQFDTFGRCVFTGFMGREQRKGGQELQQGLWVQ
ncbi:hypothetical protein D3C77_328230 [compost metagenome]